MAPREWLRFQGVLSLFLVFAMAAGEVAAGDEWDTFKAHIRQRDYDAAANWLRPRAESGNAQACFQLAQLYRNGRGVAPDPVSARQWMRCAADGGEIQAYYHYGLFLMNGVGGGHDMAAAKVWLEKAQASGVPSARQAIGQLKKADDQQVGFQNAMMHVREGNLAALKTTSNIHSYFLFRDESGVSLLNQAIKSHQSEVVEWLLGQGFPADNRADEKTPLLHLALQERFDKAVSLLMQAGADPQQRDSHGRTAFDLAQSLSYDQGLDMLAANQTVRGNEGHDLIRLHALRQDSAQGSPFHRAVEKGDLTSALTLLPETPAPWAPQPGGHTAITLAAMHPDSRMLDALLPRSQGKGWVGPKGKNALFFALESNNEQNLKLLLIAGLSPVQTDEQGMSPIEQAFKYHQPQVDPLLMSVPIDQWRNEWVAMVAGAHRPALLKKLLDAGLDPDTVSSSGKSAIRLAVESGDANSARALISAGASAMDPDTQGSTSLHLASAEGMLGMIKLLIDAGANSDQQDRAGQTPLMLAVINGQSEAVRVLLASGASWKKRNKNRQTARQLGEAMGFDEIVTDLIQAERNQGIFSVFN